MGDAHLVELLNGIEGYESYTNGGNMTEELFMDENGVPTDRFESPRLCSS